MNDHGKLLRQLAATFAMLGLPALIVAALSLEPKNYEVPTWAYAAIALWLLSQVAKNVLDTIWLDRFGAKKVKEDDIKGFRNRATIAGLEALLFMVLLIIWIKIFLIHHNPILTMLGWAAFYVVAIIAVTGIVLPLTVYRSSSVDNGSSPPLMEQRKQPTKNPTSPSS